MKRKSILFVLVIMGLAVTLAFNDLQENNVDNNIGIERNSIQNNKAEEENETEMSNNWNKRYRDNMEKMKSGDIYEVADVVRNLSFKQKEKGLSTGEKKMLNNAKQILVSELVLAEHASQEEVENLIDNKITMSFEEYKISEQPITNEIGKDIVKKFIPFDGTGTNL